MVHDTGIQIASEVGSGSLHAPHRRPNRICRPGLDLVVDPALGLRIMRYGKSMAVETSRTSLYFSSFLAVQSKKSPKKKPLSFVDLYY
jgi:hypothetical protein